MQPVPPAHPPPGPGQLAPSPMPFAPSPPSADSQHNGTFSHYSDELPPPMKGGQIPKGKRKKLSSLNPTYSGAGAGSSKQKKRIHHKLHERRIFHRVLVAGLAISLLWSTSYAICYGIINNYFIPRPTVRNVLDSNYATSDTYDGIRADFANCANETALRCERLYDDELQAEIERVENLQRLNNEVVNTHLLGLFEAQDTINQTLSILRELIVASNGTIDISTNYSLVADFEGTCPRLNSWINGQFAAAAAIGEFNEYLLAVDYQLETLESQMLAREAYDNEYLANKTAEWEAQAAVWANFSDWQVGQYGSVNESLARFAACISASSGSSFTCAAPGGPLADKFADQLNSMNDTIKNFNAEWEDYKGELDEFYGKFQELKSVVDWFYDNIDNSLIPVDQFSANEPNGKNDVDNGITTAFGINPLEAAGFDNAYEETLQTISTATGGAISQDGELNDNFGLLNFSTNDYDPEPYDINSTKDAWANDKAEAEESFTAIANGIRSNNEQVGETFKEPVNFTGAIPDSTEQILQKLPSRDIDLYAYEQEIFDQLALNLELIQQVLIWTDIAFRVIHTLVIIRKYWMISDLGKPPGDARIEEVRGSLFGQKTTFDQKVIAFITNPFFMLFVGAVFTFVVGWLCWQIYEPVYTQYVDNCVKGDVKDFANGELEGTMLFRNGNSMGERYTLAKGDAIVKERAEDLNFARDGECRKLSYNTETNLLNLGRKNDNALSDYNRTIEFNDEILSCLDLSSLESEYGVDMANIAISLGFASLANQISDRVNDVVFFPEFKTLNDSIYKCENVGACDIDCQDPDASIIQDRTWSSACVTEWTFHASFLGFILVAFTFVCINISRIEFMNAVVRVWWRHLTREEYAYLGSINGQGERLFPEELVEDGITFKEAISKAVKNAIKWWELAAYVYVVYAISLNIPWIYLLFTVKDDLRYPGPIE